MLATHKKYTREFSGYPRRGFAALVFLAAAGVAISQPVTAAGDFRMTRPPHSHRPATRVMGGWTTDSRKWPSTFVFKRGEMNCTATAIGRSVLLTAAHCVSDGAIGEIEIGRSDSREVECKMDPHYESSHRTPDPADLALCRLIKGNQDKSTTTDRFPDDWNPFETLVSGSDPLPADNAVVTLLGFGCTTIGPEPRNNGVLHEGVASIVHTSPLFVTQGDPAEPNGGAATCFGDSGGAAYYPAVKLPNGSWSRRIIGVNTTTDGRNSSIASVASGEFREWATRWGGTDPICGLTANAENCHS